MKYAIHVQSENDIHQTVMLVDGRDPQMNGHLALHRAADILIAAYTEANYNEGTYAKREEDWTGHPHPRVVVTVDGEDLDTLTLCLLEEVS